MYMAVAGMVCLLLIGGAVLGLFLASFLCLIVAEVGSVIVFSVTMSTPDERLNPLDASDADASRWIDSLSDFCSATADFNAAGLLRHVPYAGQYARQMRSLIKILNAPREDLAMVAEKRGLLDLTSIPEVRMALTDPDYQTLLVRVRQGDMKALYEAVESPITRKLFDCPGLRQFTKKLKLSDLLEDIESVQASRDAKAEAEAQTQEDLTTPATVAHKNQMTPSASNTVPHTTEPGGR